MAPKVFISYSWTTPIHQALVKEWADRIISGGVDVALDIYDLKEGHDKYAFMERMVLDSGITHVLVICDKGYAQKADSRSKGVGTESQIISKEVYDKVEQSKFIPIVCEFQEDGNPTLPVFLKSRIWIDFSTPEAVNQNWERLIRLLHGKPLHQKPSLGRAPAYLSETAAVSTSPMRAKFNTLKQAISTGKTGLVFYREDFLGGCYEFADALRMRIRPDEANLGERIMEDFTKLTEVRNVLIDWVLVESSFNPGEEFIDSLTDFLERLRELRARPEEVTSWSDTWFEAHRLFAYETFIYIVAALIKTKSFKCLNSVFKTHYLLPKSERYGETKFEKFDDFYAYSEALKKTLLSPDGREYYSPAAELIKRHAGRSDLSFSDLVQADLLILFVALTTSDARWYPQLMYYSGHGNDFPLFVKATQRKYFRNLAIITGIDTADALRAAVVEGNKRMDMARWDNFRFHHDILASMNLEAIPKPV